MCRADRIARDESGTVLLFTLGAVAVVVTTLLLVVDVVAVAARQRDGDLIADAAARAGAQQLDLADYYTGGPRDRLPLDDLRVRGAARRLVPAPWHLADVRVAGERVVVVVATTVPVGLGRLMGRDDVVVTGTGAAELRVQ